MVTATAEPPAAGEVILPALRADLEFHRAPEEEDGSEVWMIRDPVHSSFERVDWMQMEILRRLRTPRKLSDLHRQLEARTAVRVSREELRSFCEDLSRRGLTETTLCKDPDSLLAETQRRRVRPLRWLYRHYFYFRIPLVNPDAFLARTLPLVRLLSGPVVRWISVVACALGLAGLLLRFDAYIHTFPRFFSLHGIVVYAVAIALLKALHELAHAYTAKAFGNRVPAMGVAFIFLWPLAFCDVTDSWRMSDRRRRLWITAAGICAEGVIAGWALLGWTVAPPGLARSLCFVLSSVTLLSTVLVNLNPAMRFDGYYLLSDMIGVDNLQPRAFALTLAWLRRKVFSIDVPSPEPNLSTRRRRLMVAYSLYTWVYRFFLYLGICALIYHTLPKAVGVPFCAGAFAMLFLRPVIREIAFVARNRRRIALRPRLALTLAGAMALGYWLAAPRSRTPAVAAVSVPAARQVIYCPAGGVLTDLAVAPGEAVEAGQTLCVIRSAELEGRIDLARTKVRGLERELDALGVREAGRALLPQKREALLRARADLARLLAERAGRIVRAEAAGRLAWWDETLRDGVAVRTRQELGGIVAGPVTAVRAYVPETLISAVAAGVEGIFRCRASGREVRVRVRRVSPTRTETLGDAALAGVYGGPLAVTAEREGRLRLVDSVYEVEAELLDPPGALRLGQPGSLVLSAGVPSRLSRAIRWARAAVVRDSGL